MPSQSVACKCGQVSFDVSGREAGDKLSCPACDRTYKYIGGGKIEAVGDSSNSEDEHEILTVEGTEEVFSHKAIDSKETVRLKPASSRSRVLSKISHSGIKPAATDKPPDRSQRSRRPTDIPGGVLPMVGFMLLFNAVAFTILLYLFPKQDDGTRLTPWGSHIRHTSIPWPELATLFVGQIAGFLSWALYVYRFHNPRNAALKLQAAGSTPNKTSEVRRIVRKKPTPEEEEEKTDSETDLEDDEHEEILEKDEAADEETDNDEQSGDDEEELTDEELAELEAGEAELESGEDDDEHEELLEEVEEQTDEDELAEKIKPAKSATKGNSSDTAKSKAQQKPATKSKPQSADKPKSKKLT